MPAEPEEARQFAQAFRQFLSWVHQDDVEGRAQPVVTLVRDHLSSERLEEPVLGRALSLFEHVNVQVALETWMVGEGRSVEVHGLTLPPGYDDVSLQDLLHGAHLPPMTLSTPNLVDVPAGPSRTIACFRRVLLLVDDTRGSYVVQLDARYHEQVLSLEVAGLPTEDAKGVLNEVDELRNRLNIYRGQILEIAAGRRGMSIVFPELPETQRGDVVLPEGVLRRIERHTLEIGRHRDALRAAGQHLKRGLLLFGPPGTGKTHTTRYVAQHLQGTTVLILSGGSLQHLATATAMARELEPAAVVLEDVDLVAEDREYGPGGNPLLFELLDAMDGAGADADVLFLLTTNRADLLEPALAARPGRVDVAVEIGLPDADARRRLFEVYSRDLPLALTDAELETVIERTSGVTASFIKELLRRATLEAVLDTGVLESVTGDHLSHALEDLLDSTQGVTRALLGVQHEGVATAFRSVGRSPAGHRHLGWLHAPDGSEPAVWSDEPT